MSRRILVDARTPVHYTMFAPVHAAMAADRRGRFSFVASEDPRRAAAILRSLALAPDRPTVRYAPTWSPASSLNRLGVDLLRHLRSLPVNLIVKLHDRSRDMRPQYSGGVDWPAALVPHLSPGVSVLATS